MARGKIVRDEAHDGDQGETLAKLLVQELGHQFHPTGRTEVGIDGFIELRDRASGEVTAQVLACQVKTGATTIFDEDDDGFSWRAAPGDLIYWENSNVPVVVIVVRLATHEGWWRAVDEAFPNDVARAARVVRFHKRQDRLEPAAAEALWEVVRRERDRRAIHRHRRERARMQAKCPQAVPLANRRGRPGSGSATGQAFRSARVHPRPVFQCRRWPSSDQQAAG